MTPEVGASYILFIEEGHPDNRKLHVRGVVDGRFVVRTWALKKVAWNYEVLESSFWEKNASMLTKTKK